MSTASLMTVEQFAQMQTTDTEDYELVEGELIPLSSGTPLHAKVRGRLERLIGNYFETHPLGEGLAEVDCRLAPQTVRRPDLSIFLGSHMNAFDLTCIPIPFAPDIAIEILSPSESAIAVNRRTRDYISAGSQEVWLVDPTNGEIFIHANAGIRVLRNDAALTSPLLPGFIANVADLLSLNR